MKSKVVIILSLSVCMLALYSFKVVSSNEGDPWEVPESYQNMKNPVEADKESLSTGKSLYNLHCKSCHGSEGLGDGSKAAQLDTPCGDFTEDEYQSQSDGAIFYKTKVGRDDMPGFGKKIPDADDIWSIVNYTRTFE